MDETIAAIYQAGACTGSWGDALTRINNDLGMLASQIIGVSKAQGSIVFSDRAGGTSDAELAYIRQFHAVDPRVPVLLGRPAGTWLYDQDDLDIKKTHANALYSDLFLHMGASCTASIKLYENEEELHLLGILAPTGGITFEQRHRDYLDTISFHLREAGAIYQTTRQRLTQAFAGSELLQRMDRPALLLTLERGVSFANERAKTYLFEHNAFLLVRDRLVAQDRRTDEALDEAVKAITRDVEAGVLPQRRVVRLAEPVSPRAVQGSGRPAAQPAHPSTAAISLTAFVPSASMFAFGTQVQILLIVHSTAEPRAPDTLLWEAAFDLTPAQSRVAREIFSGGSVKQIAAALRVGQTTVKSHLSELFLKTGTKRQSDLLIALARLQMP